MRRGAALGRRGSPSTQWHPPWLAWAPRLSLLARGQCGLGPEQKGIAPCWLGGLGRTGVVGVSLQRSRSVSVSLAHATRTPHTHLTHTAQRPWLAIAVAVGGLGWAGWMQATLVETPMPTTCGSHAKVPSHHHAPPSPSVACPSLPPSIPASFSRSAISAGGGGGASRRKTPPFESLPFCFPRSRALKPPLAQVHVPLTRPLMRVRACNAASVPPSDAVRCPPPPPPLSPHLHPSRHLHDVLPLISERAALLPDVGVRGAH